MIVALALGRHYGKRSIKMGTLKGFPNPPAKNSAARVHVLHANRAPLGKARLRHAIDRTPQRPRWTFDGKTYLPLGAASFCTSTSSTRPYSLASMALMK